MFYRISLDSIRNIPNISYRNLIEVLEMFHRISLDLIKNIPNISHRSPIEVLRTFHRMSLDPPEDHIRRSFYLPEDVQRTSQDQNRISSGYPTCTSWMTLGCPEDVLVLFGLCIFSVLLFCFPNCTVIDYH